MSREIRFTVPLIPPSVNHYKMRTRTEFWAEKISRNRKRDAEAVSSLKKLGWKVAIVWECQLRKPGLVKKRLSKEASK